MGKRWIVFLSCILIALVVMTACGQSTATAPTEAVSQPDEESPAPTSTLSVTDEPFLPPTPDDDSDAGEPTNTPEATPTPTPTFVPAIAEVNIEVDLPYLQDGGALPPGALGRIGIGHIRYVTPVGGNANIMLGTSTGIYAYQSDTFERTWRRYLIHRPWGMSISPDGTRTISHFGWNTVPIMYDTEDGKQVAVLDGWHEAHWSPDSTLVAVEERPPWDVSSTDPFIGRINLYSGLNGIHLPVLEVEVAGFTGQVFSGIIWSPDNAHVAACGDSGIYAWNALNAELLLTIPADPTSGGQYLRHCKIGFSPDSQYLAGVDIANRFIFDLSTGDRVFDQSGAFDRLGWSGEYFLFADESGLTILDLNTLDEIASVNDPAVSDMVVSPDGDRLAVVSGGDVVVMGLPSLEIQYRVPLAVDDVFWSPGGEWVVGYDDENGVYVLIDAASGEPRFPPLVPSGGLQFLDDTTLVVVNGLNIFLLDMASGAITGGVQYNIDVKQMGWSPEGELLLLDGEEAMWAWKGEVVRLEADRPSPDMLETVEAFDTQIFQDYNHTSESPDGRFLAAAAGVEGCGDGPFGSICGIRSSEFILTRIDQETGEPIVAFENEGTGISAFDWSPDGSMLAIGEGGGQAEIANYEIIIIDPETGEELFRFEGHLDSINTLIFSPDGSRLASASNDGTVIIWNTAR